MEHQAVPWGVLGWFGGWLLSMLCLLWYAARLPLVRATRWRFARALALALGALSIALFANLALNLHDAQFDLTREQAFTPVPEALAVVRSLREPVKLTFFHRSDDPDAYRIGRVLAAMARANPLFQAELVDPDRAPAEAARFGISMPNVAILEGAGRMVRVESTEEREFALGIQRLLRERVVTVCFLEGYGEHPSVNPEFVTQQDSGASHAHNDPTTKVVETTTRGVGRLRRALESLGLEVKALSSVELGDASATCRLVVMAGPRTPPEAGAVRHLRDYLDGGGALWLMLEPGFVPGAPFSALLSDLGIHLSQVVIREPRQHLNGDPGMLAMTAYEPHPITRRLALSTLPGVRPLSLRATSTTLRSAVLFRSTSRSEQVGVGDNAVARGGSAVLGLAIEGRLTETSTKSLRAVVVGDSDFASNAFLPYASNRDLALGMVRWLLEEEAATPVAARVPVPEALVLSRDQQSFVFLVAGILPPAVMVLVGMLLWWRRR